MIAIFLHSTDPASITQSPVDVTVNQSFRAQFECTAYGNPIPQVVWSRLGNDDLSNNTDVTTVTAVVDLYTIMSYLVINSTERFHDHGVYTCTAHNNVDNDIDVVSVQGAELVVQGKIMHIYPVLAILILLCYT